SLPFSFGCFSTIRALVWRVINWNFLRFFLFSQAVDTCGEDGTHLGEAFLGGHVVGVGQIKWVVHGDSIRSGAVVRKILTLDIYWRSEQRVSRRMNFLLVFPGMIIYHPVNVPLSRSSNKEVELSGNPKFGQRIRELREAKKRVDPSYSLRRFAATVGISPTFLSKVEVGEFDPPAADKIKRMAELLDQNPDALLALAGRMDPELSEIIKDRPVAMADFLRTVREHNLSQSDIERFTRQIKEERA
ncbi:MAG: helix-turn-helix domain-containing protein, partial [Magnetococcus sp. YQC-5]